MLNDSMACSNRIPPPAMAKSKCVRASWPHLRGLTCLSRRRHWRQQLFPVGIRIDPVNGPVHLPPSKFFCRKRPCLGNMRRFLNGRVRIHPAPRVLWLQHNRPAVVDVHHAAIAVLGNNHESHFDGLLGVRPEIGQPRHENRLPVLARDIPGLLLAVFEGPLIPPASRNDDPALAEHVPEIAPGQGFFNPGIDPWPPLHFRILRLMIAPRDALGMQRCGSGYGVSVAPCQG